MIKWNQVSVSFVVVDVVITCCFLVLRSHHVHGYLLTFTFLTLQLRSSRHQPTHLLCYHSRHRKTDKSKFLSLLVVFSLSGMSSGLWVSLLIAFHLIWTVSSLHISFRDRNPREVFRKKAYLPLATSEEQFQYTDQTLENPETTSPQLGPEATPRDDSSTIQYNGNDGKPGFISFYNPRNKTEDITVPPESQSTWGRLLWLIGPAVLVSSFILPPIYLRRIVSAVFEDSLLTGSSCFSFLRFTSHLLFEKCRDKAIESLFLYLQTSSSCSSPRLSSTVESPHFFW